MLNLLYYSVLILQGYWVIGLSFLYSNAEPIKGHNVVTAEEGDFPFVAGIIEKTGYVNAERDQFCTGVLISKNHVLTAQHCLVDKHLHEIQIILGSVDLRNGTRFNVNSGINYTRWAEIKGIPDNYLLNDIVVIKLSEEVDERVAKPAELSSKKWFTLFSSEKVTAVGWGRTNLKPDKPSRYLQKASLTVLTARQCQNALLRLINKVILMEDNIFCTKVEPFTLLGCGDSGGPILNEKNKVIGINMGVCPKYGLLQSDQRDNRINLHAYVYYYKTFIKDVLMNY